ncbi:MAG: glycosyltransferase, partial [Acidobacteriota bacterium]
MTGQPPRVALVTNVLAHYRVLCFDHLARALDQQLTVYLLASDMEHRRYVLAPETQDLPLVHLPGWRWRRPPGDDRHLNDIRPVLRAPWQAIILGAWDEPTHLLLWAWAVARRRKIIFWIESTAVDLPRHPAKEAFKRLLLGRATACMVPGRRASEYCQQLGVDEQRIFQAPNATDRTYFRSHADQLSPRRAELRQARGLEGLAILFVGRLVERYKGVETLLEACARLDQRGLAPTLLIAGEGPDEGHY